MTMKHTQHNLIDTQQEVQSVKLKRRVSTLLKGYHQAKTLPVL